MDILNRSTTPVEVRLYDRGDPVHVFTRAAVELAVGEKKTVNGSGSVQIEIAPVKGLPILHSPLHPVLISASLNAVYDNSLTVVYNGFELIKLDNKYRELVGLPPQSKGTSSPPGIDAGKVARAVVMVAEALTTSSWLDTPTKWLPAGIFKVAFCLIDIFGQAAPSQPSLDLSDVSEAVQKLIDENEARLKAPHIVDASKWLYDYVRKSRSATADPANPTAPVDLQGTDRSDFLSELNNHIDGLTAFLPAMAELRDNRAIRQYCIPSYLMGVMLHLHMEVLHLCDKQQTAPLRVVDIESLRDKCITYRATLPQLEEDYRSLCKELAKTYPLMTNLESVGLSGAIFADPNSYEEGMALANGAIYKWLQGDRMVIAKTQQRLDKFIASLDGMPVV